MTTAPGPTPAEPPLSVGRYLEDWLRLHETQVQPSTWLSYAKTIRSYLKPALADIPLAELKAAQLNQLYVELLAAGGHERRPLSLRTVRYCHAVLRKALEDARRVGVVTVNVGDLATLPRIDPSAPDQGRRQVRSWTATQLRTFLDHAAGHPLAPLWVVAAGTGMRRGELLGLRLSDVDLDRRRLRVRQALSVVRRDVRLKPPKNGRSRTLSIDDRTVAAVVSRRDEQETDRRRCGPTWSNHWDLVFTNATGRPLTPDVVTREFRLLVREAPVPSIRLHDVRHTHATLLLEAGVPVKVVSERLGHATVQLTLDIYAHVLPSMDADAADRFAAHVYRTAESDSSC